MKNSIQLDLTY